MNLPSIKHLMDPSWTVDDLSITVTNNDHRINILTRDLLTLEILWEGETTNGVVSFTDKYNTLEKAKLLNRGEIKLSWSSQIRSDNPAFIEKTFDITNLVIQESDEPVLEIHFSDPELSLLANNFSTDTYRDKNPSDVIQEYTNNIGLKTEVIPPKKETKIDMFIPGHRSSREVLGGVLQEHGYRLIKDKFTSHIVHNEHLTDDKMRHTGETFLYQPKEVYRRDQVLEYNTNSGFNINKLNQSIPSENSSFDYKQTHKESPDNINKVSSSNYNTHQGGALGKSVSWKGIRQSQNDGYHDQSETINNINETQQMRIWVPGWNGNRLCQKITVEMPVPKYEEQNVKDTTISGDWIVEKVRDKIISTYFVQELFLRRAGG